MNSTVIFRSERMMCESKLIVIARWLLRLGLGGLILATGVGKALDLPGFVGVLQTYRLGLDPVALQVIAPSISVIEIALGAWILGGWRLRSAIWVAIALNAAYFLLLTSALLRGLQLPNCGCFGVYFARPLRWHSPLEDLGLIALSMLLLALSTNALRVRACLTIRAPRAQVAAIYRDFSAWPRVFPAIRAARLLREEPDRQVIEVDHRRDGTVINLLGTGSSDEIELEEFKRRYDGRFVNRFEPVPDGTRYTVEAEIRPNGFWKLLAGPWLHGHIRRQIAKLVLEPVKRVAEASHA